jgi:hypothetical protein
MDYNNCLEIWEPRSPGALRAYPGLYRDCFTFTVIRNAETRNIFKHAYIIFEYVTKRNVYMYI